MSRSRTALIATACAALAACAQDVGPQANVGASPAALAPPVPRPPPAVTRHDGRYLGWARRTSPWSPQCADGTLYSSMVVDGGRIRLIMGTGPSAPLEGAVAADDSLSLASDTARGTGRFERRGSAVVQVQDAHCGYRVALNRNR